MLKTVNVYYVEYIERKNIFKLLFQLIDKVKATTGEQFKRLISNYPSFRIMYRLI